jgi:cytochrome c oxidase subunit 2
MRPAMYHGLPARACEAEQSIGVAMRNSFGLRTGWKPVIRVAPLVLALLAGCKETSSGEAALDPAGPQALWLANLTWLFIWVCVVVWVLVMIALFVGLYRRRGGRGDAADLTVIEPDEAGERRRWTVVSACIFLTVVVLFGLLFADFTTGRRIHRTSEASDFVSIKLVGHQWWWEVHYKDAVASNTIETANEIHVPVGKPVCVELNSGDVIHSFWVPNVQGKKDLVPGHPTTVWFQVDRPGTYYGECAEYCGYQHAQMRLMVVAEEPAKFDQWLAASRELAPEPSTDAQRRGQLVFTRSTCAMCHAITGTDAGGRVGPNLTHIASRTRLAAGAIANVRGHLAGWIVDPQTIKPGARMPQNNLAPEDLRDLLDYLESLR